MSFFLQQVPTMPIKVYVWEPKGSDSCGHASMELSDGTYISWWPNWWEGNEGKVEQAMKKAPGYQNRTLDTDINAEQRVPDYTFTIPARVGLDEDGIKCWWARMKSRKKWSILNNCCDAVKQAFVAGGAKVTTSLIETPTKMIEYMEDWKDRNWEPQKW